MQQNRTCHQCGKERQHYSCIKSILIFNFENILFSRVEEFPVTNLVLILFEFIVIVDDGAK
jgi:hypothetical protein